MAISRRVLYEGEEVLLDIRPHWIYLIGPLIVTVVVVAAAVTLDIAFVHTSVVAHWVEGIIAAIPCVWLVARFVRWRRTSLIVTNIRVIERFGVFSRRGTQILLSDINRVDVRQSLLRRMVGTGQLFIEVGDGGGYEFGDVRKPVALQRVIIRRAARLHRLPLEGVDRFERQQDWPTDPGRAPQVGGRPLS
ncbi:MAG TPA: PH domain-containing protein [Acidimicrobiales bacterium]|nr:PH domain-containing protein [Acidimicrobiales bacterium]